MFDFVSSKLCRVTRYDPIRLFALFVFVWITEQVCSRIVEEIVWGERFYHWFDLTFTLALFFAYAAFVDDMADRIRIVVSDPDPSLSEGAEK